MSNPTRNVTGGRITLWPMVERKKVLFLCTGNSCRSQMAEGWLRHLAGDRFEVFSAGTHPVGVNPGAIEAMAEAGVDISAHTSDGIERYRDQPLDLVVTVCEHAAQTCPTWPGEAPVVMWPFDDPGGADGDVELVRAEFRRVRDQIRERIEAWLAANTPELKAPA